jgi:glycosyltransferase involved in cell wall biosynthesis
MALGKPTVAYDLPEHRISAGDACLYAEPGDMVDFARQLAKLIEEPEVHAHMGAIGRERIDQGLAWPYQRERLLNLYRDLTTA